MVASFLAASFACLVGIAGLYRLKQRVAQDARAESFARGSAGCGADAQATNDFAVPPPRPALPPSIAGLHVDFQVVVERGRGVSEVTERGAYAYGHGGAAIGGAVSARASTLCNEATSPTSVDDAVGDRARAAWGAVLPDLGPALLAAGVPL
jgi:hypothetical protein